jgi:hypothetical protein
MPSLSPFPSHTSSPSWLPIFLHPNEEKVCLVADTTRQPSFRITPSFSVHTATVSRPKIMSMFAACTIHAAGPGR